MKNCWKPPGAIWKNGDHATAHRKSPHTPQNNQAARKSPTLNPHGKVTALPLHRRDFLRRSLMSGLSVAAISEWPIVTGEQKPASDKALVAITLDLEMSRNFPAWETTHWDYEKGNLNDETKRWSVEACRRVRQAGGHAHCFAVGRVFEQADVTWLRDLVRAGHAVGHHT